MDHKELFNGDRAVTIHNDCIYESGPNGTDGGTFPDNRQEWVDYTTEVSKGNTYGGEGCTLDHDSSYDWSNYDDLCGPNGLAAYINYFGISYMNVSLLLLASPPPILNPFKNGFPQEFYDLFNNVNYADCIENIQSALQSHQ